MDWIHCNKCFAQLEPGITLHLTSCGHMFCNNCLDNGVKESTCLVCRAPCSIMKLVPDMNSEIQDYFTEPEEIIKKSCEVLQFQRQHRRRLLSYLLQSTKKFYAARIELKRVTELCQKQHYQLKEQQKNIKTLQAQLANQSKQQSPFNVPVSPNEHISPSFMQTTPSYKRIAKSTPYSQPYHSNLVTPARISKQRSGSFSAHSQKTVEAEELLGKKFSREVLSPYLFPDYCIDRSNTSNKISSTVFTPPTPDSAGFTVSQKSNESGYFSNTPPLPSLGNGSPTILYCNGYDNKCSFKNKMKTKRYNLV